MSGFRKGRILSFTWKGFIIFLYVTLPDNCFWSFYILFREEWPSISEELPSLSLSEAVIFAPSYKIYKLRGFCIQMKRLFLFLLVVLYLVVSSGVTLSFHYCMGRLADLEWGITEDVCSSCGHKKTSSHCCSTEAHFIKLIVDQNAEHSPVMDFTPAILSLLPDLWGYFLPPVTEKNGTIDANLFFSFRRGEVPIFIYHCLLLI